jgi:transposase-like protein
MRNVLGHLPKEQHDLAKSTLRAAWKLESKEGQAKLLQYASGLKQEWPSAANSLLEGLEEMFTINRLGLPATLRRCLATTNLIDSSHAGIRQRSSRVTHWQNGQMALRWVAAAFDETAKSWKRIMGHHQLWMLKAHLDEPLDQQNLEAERRAG